MLRDERAATRFLRKRKRMMLKFGLALIAVLAAMPLAAEEGPLWEGYWTGNVSWCAGAGEVGDETPTWYGRDGFFGIEWSCDIRTIQPTGMGNSWVLATDCLDAGYAYSETQIFLVTYEDRLLILDDSGVTANLVRCEEGKN